MRPDRDGDHGMVLSKMSFWEAWRTAAPQDRYSILMIRARSNDTNTYLQRMFDFVRQGGLCIGVYGRQRATLKRTAR